jgi:hypothetical protein
MLGRSTGLPAALRACCQRRLSASPASMQASLEPVVERAWLPVLVGGEDSIRLNATAPLGGYRPHFLQTSPPHVPSTKTCPSHS